MDDQTTIGAIGVSTAGAVVTVVSSTATTESFKITGTVPTAAFRVTITLKANLAATPGAHPVTLAGTNIETSDGNGSGNGSTEDFDVEALAVDILGPPYVIIDNNPADINEYSPYGFPPSSQYNAIAVGGSGNYTWNWSVSGNVYNEGFPTDDPINVIGKGPAGAGSVQCVATDTTTGATQAGQRHPIVQDEYVVTETSSAVPGHMGSPLLAQFGPFDNGATTMTPVLVKQTSQVLQTVTVGFTESAGAADGVVESNFGLSASTSATISGTISVQTTLNIPPKTSETIQEFPATDTDSGTYQIWGISGMTSSGKWVYVYLSPGPMPTSETILSSPYN